MSIRIKLKKKYGMLSVIKEAPLRRLPSGQINRFVLCKCDCGNEKEVRVLHLVRLRIMSCGCLGKSRNGLGNHKLCKVWRQMKDRCSKDYFENRHYFKKGIRVCEEWANDFMLFYEWSIKNGYKEGLQIDRINNSKNYSPDNCRWTTRKINVNNRDNTFLVNYKNEQHAIIPLLERLNKMGNMSAIRTRILRGWNHDKAIDTPIKKGNYVRGVGCFKKNTLTGTSR